MTALDGRARPRLAARAVLRHDTVRETDVLLLPERIVRLNASAAAILARCDGSRTVEELVSEFRRPGAPAETVERVGTELTTFLTDALTHGWIET